MSGFAGLLFSAAHRRGMRLALWLGVFVVLLAGTAWFVAAEVSANIRTETGRTLAVYQGLRTNVLSTFSVMTTDLTAEPCSPQFLDDMRRVAYLPDGINELLYISDGSVLCSVNSGVFADAPALGAPDMTAENPFGVAFWLDRDLAFLGLDGMVGTIARSGNFGMVVPQQALPATGPRWLEQELIFLTPDSVWWHRAGVPGIYTEILEHGGSSGHFAGGFHQLSCDPAGIHCIAARAALSDLFSLGWTTVGIVLLVVGVLAAWLAGHIHALILRYWSFEARFLRRLGKGSVVCAYQPLLNLRSKTVTGCEVLARWRDMDGTIVSPDRFLPIIEKHGLTRKFTSMIVEQAHAELSAGLPSGTRLQVNFNIFPQDLHADTLTPIFAPFLQAGSPFDVVVELVETAEIRPDTAQSEIEALRAAGLMVYIDDFGAGYSSMHNLAALSIDGVKLDRSFAMAPEQSVMGRMLDNAIDMVRASGRVVVVEGVETTERLNWLTAHGGVDLAQGYVIARPLLIEGFIDHLRHHGPRPSRRPRLVA
jgi:sensor c-di-GMP phosphodiesterase-like protein